MFASFCVTKKKKMGSITPDNLKKEKERGVGLRCASVMSGGAPVHGGYVDKAESAASR